MMRYNSQMGKKIDIRKVETPVCEFYESVEDSMPVTFTGRLKGITVAGHRVLLQRKPFCRLLRTLVKARQAKKTPNKAHLCKAFRLPARMYNTALVCADGSIQSAIESQKVALEDVEKDLNRQVVEAFNGPSAELQGRVRKLARLYKKRKRLLAQQGRPTIHFGKRFYQNEEAAGWKKAYDKARNDRLGCLGSTDEAAGRPPKVLNPLDRHYVNLREELNRTFETIGWQRESPLTHIDNLLVFVLGLATTSLLEKVGFEFGPVAPCCAQR